MATDALAAGFDELMWIDSDIDFNPDDVDLLRSHDLPIVSGIYPKKGLRALSCYLEPTTTEVVFGTGGGLLKIMYAAAGFLLTRRLVYETMQGTLKLPTCNEAFARPTVPYFLPMIVTRDGKPWYLGEDFSFCERARQCGMAILNRYDDSPAPYRPLRLHLGRCRKRTSAIRQLHLSRHRLNLKRCLGKEKGRVVRHLRHREANPGSSFPERSRRNCLSIVIIWETFATEFLWKPRRFAGELDIAGSLRQTQI